MQFIKKATTTVRAKVTKYEISQDEEFDTLHEKYKNSKKNSAAIEKELKILTSHIQGFGQSLQRLSTLFASEYDTSDPMSQHISNLANIMTQFQTQATEAFESSLQTRCSNHVKNYGIALEGATKSIENRDKTKYLYDEARYKVVQLLDSKKPVDQIKFKNAQHDLATMTATYNSVAYQCKKELYELIHAGAHNATVSAFIEALSTFTQQTNQILGQTIPIAHAVSKIPTYHERYPDNRETVRPVELTMQPSAGFISAFNPSSFSSPAPVSSVPTSISGAVSTVSIPSEYTPSGITSTRM